MGRPARPWFRFYTEAMRDPKIRRLKPSERWVWVTILSAARESPLSGVLMVSEAVPYSWDDLADYAGMKVKEIEVATDKMHSLGMLSFDQDLGAWRVTKWNDRQYESDSSAERVAKHRDKQQGCNAGITAVVTPPETETETESDKTARKRASKPPDDYQPSSSQRSWASTEVPGVDVDRETRAWLDWCTANGKSYRNHDAGWRTWMRNAKEFGRAAPVASGWDPNGLPR